MKDRAATPYASYLRFIKTCNENVSTITDYSIVRELMAHVARIQDTPMELIARLSNTSVPSVSRLVRRIGFDSSKDIRDKLSQGRQEFMMRRAVGHRERFGSQDAPGIASSVVAEAQAHIAATAGSLDLGLLRDIVRRLRESRTVYLLGDSLELNMLYVLQMLLVSDGIPTFAFLSPEVRDAHGMTLSPKDTVLFVSASKRFLQGWQHDFMLEAHEHGSSIIALAQDPVGDLPVDVLYRYGVEGSEENAYYSIYLLTDIINGLYEHETLMGF